MADQQNKPHSEAHYGHSTPATAGAATAAPLQQSPLIRPPNMQGAGIPATVAVTGAGPIQGGLLNTPLCNTPTQ